MDGYFGNVEDRGFKSVFLSSCRLMSGWSWKHILWRYSEEHSTLITFVDIPIELSVSAWYLNI